MLTKGFSLGTWNSIVLVRNFITQFDLGSYYAFCTLEKLARVNVNTFLCVTSNSHWPRPVTPIVFLVQ